MEVLATLFLVKKKRQAVKYILNEQLCKCVGLSHFTSNINVMGEGKAKAKGRRKGERLERKRAIEDETVEE